MTEQFTSGKTVSWKYGRIGRGRKSPPTSFGDAVKSKGYFIEIFIPVAALNNAVIVLLEPLDFTYSCIQPSIGTKTIRFWKALVTVQKPSEGEEMRPWLHDHSWQEAWERPFTCWIRETDLVPNPELQTTQERMINRLQELHEKRKAQVSPYKD